LGLAVLSSHTFQKEIQAGRVRGLKVADLALVRDMFVIWDRRCLLPIPARLFLDLFEPRQGAARTP
jgi:hypothetical protein